MQSHDTDTGLIPLENALYYKSNVFISAKYKSTLLENKIINLAIGKLQQLKITDSSSLTINLTSAEIKRVFKSKNNVYRSLKNAAKTMAGDIVLLENGKGNFLLFPIIQKAAYINGTLTIRFNEELRPFISGFDSRYTPLEIAVSSMATSNSALKFYELFEKELYASNPKYSKADNCVIIDYGVSELKFMLGFCDMAHPSVKAAYKEGNYDYDALYESLPDYAKMYPTYSDFVKRCVLPAQKELDEISNLRFEFEGIRTEGNKMGKIRFYIYANTKNKGRLEQRAKLFANAAGANEFDNVIDIPDCEAPQFTELYENYVGFHGITKKDIDTMLEKADYNKERVCEAIQYVCKKDDVNGFSNYVISVLMHPEWDLTDKTAVVDGNDVNTEMMAAYKEHIHEVQKAENRKKNSKELWETTIKTRQDFPDFLNYMQETDRWDLEDFEAVFTYDDMVNYWRKWKVKNFK